jgi:hypothetical protein
VNIPTHISYESLLAPPIEAERANFVLQCIPPPSSPIHCLPSCLLLTQKCKVCPLDGADEIPYMKHTGHAQSRNLILWTYLHTEQIIYATVGSRKGWYRYRSLEDINRTVDTF